MVHLETQTEHVSIYTRQAIHVYSKIAKLKRRLELLRHELSFWIRLIPDDEVGYYLKKTSEIETKECEKLNAELEKMEKRAKREAKRLGGLR